MLKKRSARVGIRMPTPAYNIFLVWISFAKFAPPYCGGGCPYARAG